MADFRIRVVIDPRPALAGAAKVERRMNTLGRSADRLRGQFATILGAGGVLIAFAQGTRVLANFEQTMSTVKAIAGATDAQFEQLTETARNLGATTRFTAAQAGEGLLFLSRAGFDVDESLETIGATLNLAQAGALGLGRAADIASNVLQGFRLDTDQAARVVDVMALAANRANTDVNQLGDALSFVAPVAAGLGVPLEETSAAIQALSNAALQGQRAGTGLRRVLAELETPSTKTQKIFDTLRVSADQVRTSEVGLTAALKTLKEAGVDAGQALEIFGQRGGPAFEVLVNSIPDIERFNDELLNSAGTAKRVAAIMDDNLNGALLRVKSAAEAVVLSFGALSGGTLRSTFELLATALRFLASNFDTVLRLAKAFSLAFIVLSGQVIPLAVSGIQLLTGQIVRLTAAIAANPLGALAVAITSVISLLIFFADKIRIPGEEFVTLQDVAIATFEFIADAVRVVTNVIRNSFGLAVSFVTEALGGIGLTFNDVLDFARTFANRFIGLFVGISNVISLIFSKVRDAILSFIGPDFFKTIGSAITGVVDFAGRAVGKLATFAQRSLNLIGVSLEGINVQLGDEIELPEFKIPDSVADLGAEIQTAFLAGFDRDFVGELLGVTGPALEAVLSRARELAAARQGDPATQGPAAPPGGVPAVVAPAVTGGVAGDLQAILDKLAEEQQLLGLTNAERTIATELLSIEEELTRKLTDAETALVTVQLEQLQALQTQATILDELRGPEEERLMRQEALNQLLTDGKISQSEFNDELLILQQRAAEASNTLTGGLMAGLLEIANRTKDVGKNIQEFVVGAFDKATDAIVTFATTGKFEFRSFVADLLQQLAKLALQLALTAALKQALEGAGGGGGFAGLIKTGLGALGVPGAQNGLDGVISGSGGADSQLVAFRGTPGERVQVSTPGQQGGAQQPIVVQAPPVNITNVQSMDDIPLGIESAEGEQAVLNVLSRNTEAVKLLTG